MVAVKKIEIDYNSTQHSPRLSSLLLDLNCQKNNSATYSRPLVEPKMSRIEAEYQMEEIFRCLF